MPWARRIGAGLLGAVVVGVHWRIADRLGDELVSIGGASAGDRSRIRRIDVAFVRELAPSVAPVPAFSVRPPRARRSTGRAPTDTRRATPVQATPASAAPPAEASTAAADPLPPDAPGASGARAASAASDGGTSADAVLADAASVGRADDVAASLDPAGAQAAPVPGSAERAASAAGDVDGATAAGENFVWPPSTRLSYDIVGNVRGEIHGAAQVEWLHRDERYQVHLDVRLGLPFAPLMSRRMSSEGVITAAGLAPRRYEEETRLPFRDPRTAAIDFSGDRIVGPTGAARPAVAGVQDTASQFVQLVWRFRTEPRVLVAGGQVELPLALPRRVDRWIYDILAKEPIETPAGRIEAWHLKPRRLDAPAGTMSAEVWFAPSLEYLPVRFLIRQDAETFLDLRLERLPQQAR